MMTVKRTAAPTEPIRSLVVLSCFRTLRCPGPSTYGYGKDMQEKYVDIAGQLEEGYLRAKSGGQKG